MIEAILRDPFSGIGKPEPLKYLAAGAWSRRLTQNIGLSTWSAMIASTSCKPVITTKRELGCSESQRAIRLQ